MNHITRAEKKDLKSIENLLMINNLPYKDIFETPIEFLISKKDDQLIGCIGLEKFGQHGILRSFAVQPHFQNQGTGSLLYQHLLELAKQNRISGLHLLTDTASDYFSKKGFRLTDRKNAPESIAHSNEFATLCPVSSSYMVLELNETHAA